MAPVGWMCPDPYMKGVAGAKKGEPPSRMRFIVLSLIVAEVIMADLMAAGPFGVESFEEADNAGDMGTGHGSP